MRHQVITKTALAAVIATSMAGAPLAASAQQQTADELSADRMASTASVQVAASSAPTASSNAAVSISNPADGVDPWTGTDELNAAIAEQAQAAEVAGFAAVASYLRGEEVLATDFAAIDADALEAIDAGFAKHVRLVQAAIAAANAPVEPTPTEPAQPSTPSVEPSAPAEQPGEAPAADDPVDVEDAPDDVVQKSETLEEDEIAYISRNQTTEQFIESIGEDARKLAHDADLYASVMIAQAVVESASGSSGLSCEPYNNLFGIKGSYDGKSVRMKTQEDDGEGNMETIVAEFRRYPSLLESLQDYVGLLTGNSLYEPVKKSNTTDYTDACKYLQGRYATSSTYAKTLEAYIDAYDLTRYDSLTDEPATEAATLDKVLRPTKTHAVFAKDSDAFGIDVPEPGLPAKQANPVLAGLLAALGAVAVGGFAYWLYWRRKVTGERAAELSGAHATACEGDVADDTGADAVGENAAWSVDQAVKDWKPAHAAKNQANGRESHDLELPEHDYGKDPTDPMEPLK